MGKEKDNVFGYDSLTKACVQLHKITEEISTLRFKGSNTDTAGEQIYIQSLKWSAVLRFAKLERQMEK